MNKKSLIFSVSPREILVGTLGFTLIELLVVLSIIGLIIALSSFGLTNARESARDARRKTDLETIRTGLELYRADCGVYPSVAAGDILTVIGSELRGSGTPVSCAVGNVYIAEIPDDPVPSNYYEYSSNGTTYNLCSTLENETGSVSCSTDCGGSCEYRVDNP